MPRVGLDAEAVVTGAAELIDSEGLDALTLSSLAARLGVRSPSLYAHVGGLADLRERLAVLAAEQLNDAITPAAAGLSRGDAVRAIAHAYRSWVLEHPGLYAALQNTTPKQQPAVDRALSLLRSVLRGYGLRGDDAIHAARLLRSLLHGFTTLEGASGFGIPVDLSTSFDWMLAAVDRGFSTS